MRLFSPLIIAGLVAFATVFGGAEAQPDPAEMMEKIKPMLDKPIPTNGIPPEAGKYIKQGEMFFKMFLAKLKTPVCKENYEWFWNLAKRVATKKVEKDETPRKVIDKFCDMGSECVGEAINVALDFAKGNQLMEKMIKSGLQKTFGDSGMDLNIDDLAAGAPMAYTAGCMAFTTQMGSIEIGAGGDDDDVDEKEEL